MATLDPKHKRLVVKRLAMFDPPREVQEALKSEYGVEASKSQLGHYDPTTRHGRQLADKWKELFWETREAFKEMEVGTAIHHKAKRLRELEKMLDRLKQKEDTLDGMNNHLGAVEVMEEIRDLLEQVAREMGQKYTASALIKDRGQDSPDKVARLLDRLEAMRDDANEYEPPEMA